MIKFHYKKLLVIVIAFLSFSSIIRAQQFTADFSTAPTILDYPGYPVWKEFVEVTLDGVVYQIDNGGNGAWVYKTTGGESNSGNVYYETAGDANIIIKRKDEAKFAFYGVWVKYTNYTSYPAPYLTVGTDTYGTNNTLTVSKTSVGTSFVLRFSGLKTLYLDNLIVGPAPAEVPTVSTNTINTFSNSSALLGGSVSNDNGAAVTEKGIVYNTTTSPTVANNKINMGTGTGAFSQTVNSLSPNTTYYVKAYAINSAGTSYGTERTFTTAADFTLQQTHNFNTAWVSTTSQATPFTKYVEGWNVTGTSTNTGLVSVSRIAGTTTTSPAEGLASLRTQSATSTEELASVSLKTATADSFDLQSLKVRYMTRAAGTSFNTLTVAGYKNGVAVSGAVATLTGISPATTSSYAFSSVDMSGNNSFNNIDEFRITASNPVGAAKLAAVDMDMIVVQNATPTHNVTLPVNSLVFNGHIQNKAIELDWKAESSKDVSHFNIQHSEDGINFIPVGNIEVTNQATRSYSFIHNVTTSIPNFYRLKIVDINGEFKYSPVVKVLPVTNTNANIVFPNPVINNKFYIKTNSASTQKLSYVIYNNAGEAVKKGMVTSEEQPVLIPELTKGVYHIKLSNNLSSTIIKK